MSTIAIDFDDTFTADMDLWSGFIRTAQAAGHDVICVTARRDIPRESDYVRRVFAAWDCEIDTLFTDRASKLESVERAGVAVDIWIDNDPSALVNGHE